MAIVNRTLDASEQRRSFTASFTGSSTSLVLGNTLMLGVVPYNSVLSAITVAAIGLSGSPTMDLRVNRFIVGTGVTTIAGGATTLTLTAWGTSGVQAMVLAASGSSFLNLLANDVLVLTQAGANTATTSQCVTYVLQATQDIKTQLGV